MSGDQQRVLVVDDDPDIRESVRLILESQGYEVQAAKNADEGMAKALEQKPDLILLDVMLPTGTEGFHFVWSLRNQPDPTVRDIPIVIITAIHGTTELRLYPDIADSSYGPGEYLPVQGFLEKPFDPPKLISTVEQALRTQAPNANRGDDR